MTTARATAKPRTKTSSSWTTNTVADASRVGTAAENETAAETDAEAGRFPHEGREDTLHVGTITPSPINPRQHFDEAELWQLAESLKTHGQLQNITVRETAPDQYELIAGERRYRAAKVAGLTHLRCRVIVCDDNTAIELRGIENYRREQFNAIEEALWFQQMIGTKSYNQTSLAEHLGITPGQVSNRLRLLKLPEDWQRKIMIGALPPTHARALIPWADRQNVLDALADSLKGVTVLADLSVAEFEKRIIDAARNLSRSMNDNTWNGPKFKVTDDLLKQLDVIEMPEYIGMPPAKRAFNVELWDQLNQEAIAERDAAVSEDDDDDDQASGGRQPTGSPKRDETKSHLTDWNLRDHFARHFAQSIAAVIKADAIPFRMVLADSGNIDHFVDWIAERENIETPEFIDETDAFRILAKCPPKAFVSLAHEYVRDQLGRTSGPTGYSFELLIDVAAEMQIEPLRTWQPDAALLDLCSTDQLKELFTDEMADPKKLKLWARERTLKEALENWPAGYVPKLLEPKALSQQDD